MLYLGIDQHKRQLTVNLRSEDGLVVLKRQVSTQWEKVRAFFADLAEKAGPAGGFLAILEKKVSGTIISMNSNLENGS
jgi:hypothetical protein